MTAAARSFDVPDRGGSGLPTSSRVLIDYLAECARLQRLVAELSDDQWTLPTPAPGWTVTHQVAHMTATFRLAAMAAGDPVAFEEVLANLGGDFNQGIDNALQPFLQLPPAELLAAWRQQSAAAARAIGAGPLDRPVPWLARRLTAGALACAGIMEIFAHGQDIADAVGAQNAPTDRLIHLVEFAIGNWDFGYQVRGLAAPALRIGYDLESPSGKHWVFGDDDAEEWVTGSAADFCLLVTRRRHRDDLDLIGSGAESDRWLGLAQAYRGPAGPGRQPLPATEVVRELPAAQRRSEEDVPAPREMRR